MEDVLCNDCFESECSWCDDLGHTYEVFIDQEEYRCPCCDSPSWSHLL